MNAEMRNEQIVDGVFRLGTKWANWYLIEDKGALTVLDTGFKGYRKQLPTLLERLGKSFSDIKAIVVGHYHSDHLGNAQTIAEESGAQVLIHPLDLPYSIGKEKAKVPNFFPLFRYPTIVAYLMHAARNGGMAMPTVSAANSFEDGEILEVPGELRVIHTPGHTPGHSSFYMEKRNVLFSSDALLTTDVRRFTGPPSIMPPQLNTSHQDAVASLEKLEALKARIVLPGHGEPWDQGVNEAVELARAGELAR